jgi:hypothetical protein
LIDIALAALAASADGMGKGEIASLAARQVGLTRRLEKFSFPATVELLAGLLTLKENHVATRRIEALIHLAAVCCKGRAIPTLAQLREWMNKILLRDALTHLEDPVEDVFVSNVCTWFGNGRLFEGNWAENDYYVQSCLGSLNNLMPKPWAKKAQDSAIALLKLTEAVAHRAEVQRFALCETPPHEPLRIVSSVISRAHQNVVFKRSDLVQLIGNLRSLDPFMFRPDDALALREQALGNTSLERRPLVATENHAVVALPTAIGAAIRQNILQSAKDAGELSILEETLGEMQFQEVFHIGCRGWNIQPIANTFGTPMNRYDVVGTFDLGSYIHLVFMPDSMAETDATGLQGSSMLQGEIEKRIDTWTNVLASQSNYRRGLTLIVHGGIGRGFAIGFREAPAGWQRLALTLPDFMRLGWDSDLNCVRAWKLLSQEDLLLSEGVEIANLNGFMNL